MSNQPYLIADRNRISTQLIRKTSQDLSFRRKLLRNPRAVVSQEIGMKLPGEFQLQVLEQPQDKLLVVLPPARSNVTALTWEAPEGTHPMAAQIVMRALQDPSFRRELIAYPQAAARKILGTDASQCFSIQVIEETEDSFCVVLPPSQEDGATETSGLWGTIQGWFGR